MQKLKGEILPSCACNRVLRILFLSVIALIIISSFLLPVPALAAFDPPHNESSGVDCGGCHGDSLKLFDPQGGPIDHPLWDTGISSDEAYNAICLRCHVTDPTLGNYGGSSAPLVKSHAPNGTAIRCTACHHNHYQEQLDIGSYNRGSFFIVTGTGSAISYSEGETTIEVTSIQAKNPSSVWASDLNKLADKTELERGALLVPRRSYSASRWPMFTIKSITINPKEGDDNALTVDGTITVKGNVSDTAEAKARVADFGIFYGQQLRGIMEISPGNYSYMEFYDRTGANGLADDESDSGIDPTPNDICQVCHTLTNHWRNDGTVSIDGTHTTYSGTNCMVCHDHVNELNAECDSCHDYPPGDLTGLVQPPDATGSSTAGAHTKHVDSKGYSCDYCHLDSYGKALSHNNGNKGGGDKNITMGFSLFDGAYQGGDYDGQDTVLYNATATSPVATTVDNTGIKTCTNLYCHGVLPDGTNWGSGADPTPVWDDPATAECGDCHRATYTNPPTRGTHEKHTKRDSGNINSYDCSLCHPDPAVDDSLHGNNKSEIIFSNDPKTSGGTYNGSNDMLGTYGSCDNVYCHSTIQSSPPGSTQTFRTTPAWGGGLSGCGVCHYTYNGTPGLETGSHEPHFYTLATQECLACHNYEGEHDLCFSCHNILDFDSYREFHANYEVNVLFSPPYGGSYSGSLAPGDAYGSCSNVYCHGNYDGSGLNATPTWGDPPTAACGTCHGAANNAVPASGSHAKHAGNDRINTGPIWTNQMNIACTVCHEDIIDGSGPDSYTIQSKAKHVSEVVDWKFDTSDTRITGSEAYSVASGTETPTDGDTGAGHRDFGICSNVYCHSNVQPDGGIGPPTVYTTPANLKWGTTTACFGCHAGETGSYSSRHSNIHTGSHDAHVAGTAETSECKTCHNWFYPDESGGGCSSCHPASAANLEGSRHVNGSVDLLFSSSKAGSTAAYNGTPEPGDGYSNCANITCHGDGTHIRTGDNDPTNATPAWGGTVTGCNICHGNATYGDWRQGMPDYANGSPKENSHAEHINQPDIDNCSFCHPDTTLDSLSINNQYAHGNSYYDSRYERDTDGAGGENTFANRDVKLRYMRTSDTLPQYNQSGSGNCSVVTCHGYPDYLVFTESKQYTPVKMNVYWGEYVTCGECHLRQATAAGTTGQADVDSYQYGDGLHASIDNDQWLYSGHGKTSGTYDASGNQAADFGGAANCTEWFSNFFDAVKYPFQEERCDPCFYCHDDSVSHDDGSNPFRLVNNNALGNGWNDVCLVCHGTGSAGYDPDGAGSMGSVNRTTSGVVDKYHFGSKHGAGNDGGSLCWDCHDPHGDRIAGDGNIFMIHEKVTVEKLDEFGTPDLTVSQIGEPVFIDNQTGSDYASVNPGPYTGLCNVCHATAANGGSDHYTWQSGDGHNISQKCTDCHLHSGNATVNGNAFVHGGGGSGCDECHGHEEGYLGASADQYGGSTLSHSTHTEDGTDVLNPDVIGPRPILACDACHDTNNYPFFKSGTGSAPYDLAETDVCDPCHSQGGPYNGVNDATVGAKNNWSSGVYTGSNLTVGKEKWCVTCHDSGTSVLSGRQAPDIAGNNTTWGYYVSGHGRIGAAEECGECHGVAMNHSIDGIRTYQHASDNYKEGLRLKDIGGIDPMNIPNTAGGCGYNSDDFKLCWECHDEAALLNEPDGQGMYGCANPFVAPYETGFRNMSNSGWEWWGDIPANAHFDHLSDINTSFSTDWWSDQTQNGPEARTSCPACHNVHGDDFGDGTPTKKMTWGELKITWDTDVDGDYGQVGPGNTWNNRCNPGCHGQTTNPNYKYYRPVPASP